MRSCSLVIIYLWFSVFYVSILNIVFFSVSAKCLVAFIFCFLYFFTHFFLKLPAENFNLIKWPLTLQVWESLLKSISSLALVFSGSVKRPLL